MSTPTTPQIAGLRKRVSIPNIDLPARPLAFAGTMLSNTTVPRPKPPPLLIPGCGNPSIMQIPAHRVLESQQIPDPRLREYYLHLINHFEGASNGKVGCAYTAQRVVTDC